MMKYLINVAGSIKKRLPEKQALDW